MSKKVVLSADEATAVVSVATAGDIISTLITTDEAVLGNYGLIQRAGLVVAGMAFQSYRTGNGINPF